MSFSASIYDESNDIASEFGTMLLVRHRSSLGRLKRSRANLGELCSKENSRVTVNDLVQQFGVSKKTKISPLASGEQLGTNTDTESFSEDLQQSDWDDDYDEHCFVDLDEPQLQGYSDSGSADDDHENLVHKCAKLSRQDRGESFHSASTVSTLNSTFSSSDSMASTSDSCLDHPLGGRRVSGHENGTGNGLIVLRRELPNYRGSMFTRSFRGEHDTHCFNHLSLALKGYRVMRHEENKTEFAQYHISSATTVGTAGADSWRRYTQFCVLAREAQEQHEHFQNMGDTVAAWEAVESHKSVFFRKLDHGHLVVKMEKLDRFLGAYLFETRSCHALLRFLEGED